MNIWLDDCIYRLQTSGGISRVWDCLTPALKAALLEATFDNQQRPDVFLSTYYQRAPEGVKSIALVYDFIHERDCRLGANHIDAVQKRQAIASADAVVAISQFTAADCLTYCQRSATVAYCGGAEFQRALPDAVAAFRRKYQLDKPYFLVVGRRELYKNVTAVYQAWGQAQTTGGYTLLAVGGADPGPAETAFATRYPATFRHVRLTETELAAAYTAAAALVYPSIYEGFGLPLVEALACGCPVICGSGGSLSEVAGNAAVYVDVFRPRSIAAALDKMAQPDFRLDLTLTGYEQARQFTWRGMAEQVANVIRNVVYD